MSGVVITVLGASQIRSEFCHWLPTRFLEWERWQPNRYDDPALRAFAAQKVEVYADPAVKGSGAKVDIEMDDGTAHSARCEHPLGSFENPLFLRKPRSS